MKRKLSLLLIVLLLLCPMLSARADGGSYVQTDVELFSAEELDRLNARAAEIYEQRGVAVYFFFMADVTELIDYTEDFAKNSVPEENALILGMNDSLYYFYAKGRAAEVVFTDDAKNTLWAAFAAVRNDAEGKVRAYFDKADELLVAYFGDDPEATDEPVETAAPEPTEEPYTVPSYIALTAGGKPAFVDAAQLLTASEAEALSEKLVEIGNRYQCDVAVVTVPDLGDKTAEEYADDFFDYNGYGYGAVPDANGTTINGDGILLLLAMADRDFAISTSGYGITAFTDFGIQTYLEDRFLPYLRQNDYDGGFHAFADACEALLRMAREDIPYDCYHVYAEESAMPSSTKATLNRKAEELASYYGVGVYFVQTAENVDPGTYLNRFVGDHVFESDAILLCITPNGYMVSAEGSAAQRKFTEKALKQLGSAILPYYGANDIGGTATAYMEFSEKILSKRPLNLFTLALAILAGSLFAFIPVGAMKKQLTDVSENRNANSYMAPDSFRVTQKSDVLLNTHVTRSVHVTPSESRGGNRGGGGGFHGGSSTHTSSSGGTHGGHSGKF